jgi:hypothetical protein
VCVTGSRATPGFTDAAIGVYINRSTIPGLPRGTRGIEYVRDGGRINPDSSGLRVGTAECPAAGFTVPNGVLVQLPADRTNRWGNGWFGNRDGRWGDDGRDRFDRHFRHHRHHRGFDAMGFRVRTDS